MTEEKMLQQLYDQIDRLVTMQNTMLTVVGALFAIIIAIFAFFQWRINQRDQSIIIKSAKEEIIRTLIKDYELLEISNNKTKIKDNYNYNKETFLTMEEDILDLKNELKEKDINLRADKVMLRYYFLIKETIISKSEKEGLLNEKQRDELLYMIKDIRNDKEYSELKLSLSDFLFALLNEHSKEKLNKDVLKE